MIASATPQQYESTLDAVLSDPNVDAVIAIYIPVLPTDAPKWAQPDGRVKLSAGWLIERAGFAKGTVRGNVGISIPTRCNESSPMPGSSSPDNQPPVFAGLVRR